MNQEIINLAYQFLKKYYDDISTAGYKNEVLHLGLFGSILLDKKSNDIDILLVTNDCYNKSDLSEKRLIDALYVKMTAPQFTDNFTLIDKSNHFVEIGKNVAKTLKIKFAHGIGPNRTQIDGIYAHLNGPMSCSTWDLFIQRFPFHAQTIRNNYLPYIGSELKGVNIPFNYDKKRTYIKIMSQGIARIEAEPRYIFKVAKSATLLLGMGWTSTDIAIKNLYQKGIISNVDRKRLENWFANKDNYDVPLMQEVGNSILQNLSI